MKKNYVINKYYKHVLSNLLDAFDLVREPSIKQIKNIMFKKIQRKILNKVFSQRISQQKVNLNKGMKDTIKFIERNIIN